MHAFAYVSAAATRAACPAAEAARGPPGPSDDGSSTGSLEAQPTIMAFEMGLKLADRQSFGTFGLSRLAEGP